jgi:ribosomal protein L19
MEQRAETLETMRGDKSSLLENNSLLSGYTLRCGFKITFPEQISLICFQGICINHDNFNPQESLSIMKETYHAHFSGRSGKIQDSLTLT